MNSNKKYIYDPFAGDGDIFTAMDFFASKNFIGLDIDSSKGWKTNDSLLDIPYIENSIIITNPPYLTNYSASRKKIGQIVHKYFADTEYDDLYLVALEKMIATKLPIVAIIPETFINSNFKRKHLLHSITILEENPFKDTETPVCVVCIDGNPKNFSEVKIFKNNKYLFSLETIEKARLSPSNRLQIKFNDVKGWLALKAVDGVRSDDKIRFDFKKNFDYSWDKGIKISSRLITLIGLELDDSFKDKFINKANKFLNIYRAQIQDCTLSPFKGNNKEGNRRRRLDYKTARAILEITYNSLGDDINGTEKHRLF